MSAFDPKRWAAVLRKLQPPEMDAGEFLSPPPAPPGSDPLTHHAVFAMLLWEASTPLATAALKRLLGMVVDYNELRVCRAEDVAGWLGDKYPLAKERSLRLRAMLSDVYNRQQSVQLSPLLLGSRKETVHALAALAGITPFVTARVLALGLSRAAVPVDERLRELLYSAKLVAADSHLQDIADQLNTHVTDEARVDVLARLQYWSDIQGVSPQRALPSEAPVPTPKDEPPPAADVAGSSKTTAHQREKAAGQQLKGSPQPKGKPGKVNQSTKARDPSAPAPVPAPSPAADAAPGAAGTDAAASPKRSRVRTTKRLRP